MACASIGRRFVKMSNELSQMSSDPPSEPQPDPSEASSQAERLSQNAEIVRGDGTRETVELRAERLSWSGALPRPDDFARFGEIVPDAPERILRMAEREQQHRIDLEAQIVPANNAAGRRGQWLGAGISVLAMVLAVLVVVLDGPWQVAVALLGVPVLSVARSLVTAIKARDE